MANSEEGEEKGLLEEEKPTDSGDTLSKKREILLALVLLTSQFTALCTDTFLFPFFPQEAKSKGLTDTQIGLVFSSFELSRFVTSLIVGNLIGRTSPKTLCFLGSIVTTLSCVTFGLVTYSPNRIYLPLCIVVRMIAGSGTATLTVTVMTILLKSTTFQTSTVVGLVEMLQGAGYAAGPALGSAIQQLGGYTPMFWTMGSCMCLPMIGQLFIVPSIAKEESPKKTSLHMMRVPGIVLLSIHCFTYKVIGSSRAAGISNFLVSSFHTHSTIIGLLFGVRAALYLIGCPIITRIINKGFIYSPMILALGTDVILNLFTGPSPLLDFLFHGQKYFELTATLISVSNFLQSAIYVPPFQAAISLAEVNGHDRESVHTYGMVTGMLNSGLGLGAMVGPVLSGAITDSSNFIWTLTFMAGLALAMAITLTMFLIWMRITKQPLSLEKKYLWELLSEDVKDVKEPSDDPEN